MNIIIHFFLKDERDLPFLKIIFITFIGLFPLAILLVINKNSNILLTIIYWFILKSYIGPYYFMLHNMCHKNPWQRKIKKFFNIYVSILGLLFGLPPKVYYYHHIKMHHKEENNRFDISSTEKYKRDSLTCWIKYYLRFTLFGMIDLINYFHKLKKYRYAFNTLISYIFFYLIVILSSVYNIYGAAVVFIIPTLICWFAIMYGNWAQHAFIDLDDPCNPYKNSITIIDSTYNAKCFNDGYHIEHHLYPGAHWSELPKKYNNDIRKYEQNDAIIFKDINYLTVWYLLMLKKYTKLATFYVDIKDTGKSLAEISLLLKKRIEPRY